VAGSCDILLGNGLRFLPAVAPVCVRQEFEKLTEFMLACTPGSVNATREDWLTLAIFFLRRTTVADVQIDDGIIKIFNLDVQDPKAAAVLAEYPQVRWAEITRRALKIGLGYLKGGGKD
jgi:hypothetical protein